VDVDEFIIAVYCAVDDGLRALAAGGPWRTRGPRPVLADSEALTMGVAGEFLGVDTEYRSAKRDPWPAWSRLLSRFRFRIDTVFGQLAERTHARRVWARDHWHLCSRLLRKVLSHTLAVGLCTQAGHPRLQLARLPAA
jgi:hypothetical protein